MMSEMPDLNEFSAIPEGPEPGPIPDKVFDWKKSNGVKWGVAIGLALLTVLIFCLALGVFGGGKKNVAPNAGDSTTTPTPPPSNPPPDNPPSTDSNPPTPSTDPNNPSSTPTPGTENPAAPTSDNSSTPNPNPDPNATPSPAVPPSNFGGVPAGYPAGYGPPGGTSVPPTDPAKPPLADDIKTWKKDDYVRARRESHPKLAEALEYARKNARHDEKNAQNFIDLLTPIKQDVNPSNPGNYSQPVMPASPQVIETLIFALTENGTDLAKKILKEILAGEFITDDDRSAVDAVMKGMAFHPSEENDDLLVLLLTKPESVRKAAISSPAGAQPLMAAAELRTKAQEAMKSASDSLRLKLADHFVKSSFDVNDPAVQLLLQEDPANLRAQLALYQSEEINKDTTAKLEQYFLNYASLAIGLTTGIPSGVEGMPSSSATPGYASGPPPGYGSGPPGYSTGAPPGYGGVPSGYGGSPSPTAGTTPTSATIEKLSDVERGVKLAKTLWTSQLVEKLTEQLDEARSLEKSAPSIVLASAFPIDSLRGTMIKMMKKRQIDGPAALATTGWSDRVLNDPGTLVLVKMLNRREKKLPRGAGSTGPGPGYGGTPPGGTSGTMTKAEATKKAEADWYEESKKLVGLWCNRFEAAAQAQRKAVKKNAPIGEPAPTKLDDFEIPKEKDTEIEDAYQLNWPDKAPPGLAEAKPGAIKIQYFRLTQTGMLKKTAMSYKKVLKNAEWHDTEQGIWADVAPKTTGPSAPRRSLDVLITKADKSPYDPTVKEEPTDLEIHILAIEIADPGVSKE
jgi:hypothetical protein